MPLRSSFLTRCIASLARKSGQSSLGFRSLFSFSFLVLKAWFEAAPWPPAPMPLTFAKAFRTRLRPFAPWSAGGGPVATSRIEEISRELRLMKEAGIGGVEIQSFNFGLNPKPAPDVAARVESFLSPEWFGHVKHAIEEGQRLGMIVDLTFGSGWPFGGPHIPPELGAKF